MCKKRMGILPGTCLQDKDRSLCAKQYHAARFGRKYEGQHDYLEKDTAQSFWNVHKSFLLMHDVKGCLRQRNKVNIEIDC